jgi:tRNA (guanine-N7-)-methyltransferase
MPRHTIRQPKSDTDLSGLYCEKEDLPETISSESLFGNNRPLEIEIGSGKGLFLAAESIANPDRNFFGIEIIDKYAKHSAARLLRAGSRDLGNARMLAGNAEPYSSHEFRKRA